jgi:Glycosyl transferase family 2
MSERPKVSIIIPSYDAAAWLPDSIESALAQTLQDFEVILVDDGSKDKTKDVVLTYGARVIYVSQENRGAGAARNRAIGISRGDYLVFLDADDILLPRKLESQVSFLDAHPEVDVVFSDVICFRRGPNGGEVTEPFPSSRQLRKAHDAPSLIREILPVQNVFPPIAATVRCGCVLEIGGFDETLVALEDWDLWYRLAQTHSFAYLEGLVAKYRLVETGVTANRPRQKKAMCQLADKIEASASFASLSPRARASGYFSWGVMDLEYGEPAAALAKFEKAIRQNPQNLYARSAYLLTRMLGQRAVFFYHLKRNLFGLERLPGL